MPLGAFKAALMGTAGATTAGDVVLLSTQTASDSASLTFSSGITSTYGEYIFKFYNINPATDAARFEFQFNATDSTSYDETVTTTRFRARHSEGDATAFEFEMDYRSANGDSYIALGTASGNAADESQVGELHLFNPASTTYVKQFYARDVTAAAESGVLDAFVGGYVNTTTAIDDIQFKMSSGNFDGKIKMWGVK